MKRQSGGLCTVHSTVPTQSFKAHFCLAYKGPRNGTLSESGGQNSNRQGRQLSEQNLGNGSWREDDADCGDQTTAFTYVPHKITPRGWWLPLLSPTNIQTKKTKSKSHRLKMPFYVKCTAHAFYTIALPYTSGEDPVAYMSPIVLI